VTMASGVFFGTGKLSIGRHKSAPSYKTHNVRPNPLSVVNKSVQYHTGQVISLANANPCEKEEHGGQPESDLIAEVRAYDMSS